MRLRHVNGIVTRLTLTSTYSSVELEYYKGSKEKHPGSSPGDRLTCPPRPNIEAPHLQVNLEAGTWEPIEECMWRDSQEDTHKRAKGRRGKEGKGREGLAH